MKRIALLHELPAELVRLARASMRKMPNLEVGDEGWRIIAAKGWLRCATGNHSAALRGHPSLPTALLTLVSTPRYSQQHGSHWCTQGRRSRCRPRGRLGQALWQVGRPRG